MKALQFNKIISVITLILTISIFGQLSDAVAGSCAGSATTCSSISATNCGTGSSYYQISTDNPNTQLTYCTQCSVCVAGFSDCIKGALGCQSCQINTGGSSGSGVQCVAASGQCQASSGSCSWSD